MDLSHNRNKSNPVDFGLCDDPQEKLGDPAKSHRKLYSITPKLVPDEIDDFKPKKKTMEKIR